MSCAPFLICLSSSGNRKERVSRESSVHSMISISSPLIKSINPMAGFYREADVLVVGAGPTGLVLALWLTRLGVRARIVDVTTEPATTSRALGVQARTLELYRQVGLADAVV